MTLMTFLEQNLPTQLAEALVLRQQKQRGMVAIKGTLSISLKALTCLLMILLTRPLSTSFIDYL